MSIKVFWRVFLALALSVALAFDMHRMDGRQQKAILSDKPLPRYRAIIAPYLYPLFLGLVALSSLFILGPRETLKRSFCLCFDVLVLLMLYVPLLLLILPTLRRHISARACALLWLIPNFLYMAQHAAMELDRPLWVLRAPIPFMEGLCVLWAAGFFISLSWKLLGHLRFRQGLLKAAYPVKEAAILELWQRAYYDAGLEKSPYSLLRCPGLRTPLSIGFFRRSIRVLLPERDYSPEELELIFRHELIHIGRQDSATKFFLVFCSALCWFDPLLWIAARKSADDLELSCDESVLQGADDETRRRYAALLLSTAGDDRGFSTCLSASAKGLRYRLENVLAPRRRWLGGLTIGLVTLGLLLSCGSVAWAYSQHSAGELLFREELSAYDPSHIFLSQRPGDSGEELACSDAEAFLDQLSQLQLLELTGSYNFPQTGRQLSFLLHGETETIFMDLQEEAQPLGALLKVTFLREKDINTEHYLLQSSPPWEELLSLLGPAQRVEPEVFPPDLGLYFNEAVNGEDGLLYASRQLERLWQNGVEQPVYYVPEDSINGVHGYGVEQVQLHFDYPPAPEDYRVVIENWDRTVQDHIQGSDLEDYTLPLAPYDAHYSVYAHLADPYGNEYDMAYRFDITGA